ncbi:MAG: undecaprenyl-diphosphatase UppP [Spirochaetia bacterium]|nr:undecaprenyl-diphosphatase UppP [Spirochaetia bacterium]
MGFAEALLLGIIQGLTEFIPVSSTAHLRIGPALLGLPDPGAAYSAVIQIGTLISLLIYFRMDLFHFAKSTLNGIKTRDFSDYHARMVWYLAAGTLPICIFGYAFARYITGPARSLYVIAASLIVFAVILWVIDRSAKQKKAVEESTLRDVILIGLAQCLALIPGASRSGTTLMMGLTLGYTRPAAMRISFLLSIPAIAISGFYELYKERHELASAGWEGLAVATAVSFFVGYAAIAFLLRYLRTHSTAVFVVYRIVLGIVILALLSAGILKP